MEENKEKLKVGLFIDTWFPMVDGVIMVVDNYARRLSKFCDVVVFAPEGRKKFDDSTLPYKVVRCKKKFKLGFLDYDLPLPNADRAFKKALEDAKLDIVHIHSPFSIGKMGVMYAKKHNIPAVATMHSQYKQDFKKAVKLKCLTNIMVATIINTLNKCTECFAVNEGVENLFVKEYKLKAKTSVLYNATDLVKIDFKEQDFKDFDNKYGITPEEKVFVFVGRIIELKNVFFIAKALKKLKEDGLSFKMFYVGSGPDLEKLKKKVTQYGLENNVVFAGKITNRDEMAMFYARSNLTLFPSIYDTDGLIKYEAACYSTPTASVKGFLCASNIKDGVNGYLSDYSVESFAKRIEDVFKDEKEYAKVCENAHKDLYNTWDKSIDKLYAKYLAICKGFKTMGGKTKKAKKI